MEVEEKEAAPATPPQASHVNPDKLKEQLASLAALYPADSKCPFAKSAQAQPKRFTDTDRLATDARAGLHQADRRRHRTGEALLAQAETVKDLENQLEEAKAEAARLQDLHQEAELLYRAALSELSVLAGDSSQPAATLQAPGAAPSSAAGASAAAAPAAPPEGRLKQLQEFQNLIAGGLSNVLPNVQQAHQDYVQSCGQAGAEPLSYDVWIGREIGAKFLQLIPVAASAGTSQVMAPPSQPSQQAPEDIGDSGRSKVRSKPY